MRLTQLIVARSQLLTAIELFFADRDPVSVQALAGNARELLESLCRLADVRPMTELLLQDHPNRPKSDIYAAMNIYRNCFKHLGSNEEERLSDQATLDQFDDSKNEYLLYICAEDYVQLRKAMPVPMQVLQAWFCALHTDLLRPKNLRQQFLDLFPGIQQMTREQQKGVAVALISRFSNDPMVIANPATEPLVITG
jgi:hypothetical protein